MKILSAITYTLALMPYAALIIYRKQIVKEFKEAAKLLFTWEEEE